MGTLVLLDRLSIGGAERHAAQLSRRLPELGCEIILAVYLDVIAQNFPKVELPTALTELRQRSFIDPRGWWQLGNYISESNVSLVLAVNQSALVVAVISRLLGFHRAKVVCLFHTTIVASLSGRLRLPIFYWAVARSDGVIFVSKNQAAYWLGRNLPVLRSTTIQNGVDIDMFALPSPGERQEARSALGLPPEAFVICLCARFAPEKNHRDLIEAVRLLRLRGVDARALFVGGGPLQEALERFSDEHGVKGAIVFCGQQQDVRPFLWAADTFAMTSLSVETFSLAALEAMATGLPTVLSDIGGASEIVSEGETGFLFPPGDTAALTDRLNQLAAKDLSKAMGSSARNRVVENFSIQRMLGEFYRFLDHA